MSGSEEILLNGLHHTQRPVFSLVVIAILMKDSRIKGNILSFREGVVDPDTYSGLTQKSVGLLMSLTVQHVAFFIFANLKAKTII